MKTSSPAGLKVTQLMNDCLRFITEDFNYSHDDKTMADLVYKFMLIDPKTKEETEKVEIGHKYPLILGTMMESLGIHAAKTRIPKSKKHYLLRGFSTEFKGFLYPGEDISILTHYYRGNSHKNPGNIYCGVVIKRNEDDVANMWITFSDESCFEDIDIHYDLQKSLGVYDVSKERVAGFALATGTEQFGLDEDVPGLVIASRSAIIVRGVRDPVFYPELNVLENESLFPIYRNHTVTLTRHIHNFVPESFVNSNLEARISGSKRKPVVDASVIGYYDSNVLYRSCATIDTLSRRAAIKGLKDLP